MRALWSLAGALFIICGGTINRHEHFTERNITRFTPREKTHASAIKETRSKQFIRKQLINKNGAICSLCDKPIETMKDCTIDHIVPISKGGLTAIENCQLAHRSCNLSKGNKEA